MTWKSYTELISSSTQFRLRQKYSLVWEVVVPKQELFTETLLNLLVLGFILVTRSFVIKAIVFIALFSFNVARATVINYDTTGSSFTGTFNGTAANVTSISVSSGASTATLSYNPVQLGSTFNDDNPGTNISYGFFTLAFTGPDAAIAFPTFTFSLKVNETAPGVGSQSISAVSNSGSVSADSSTIDVFYVPTAFTLPSALSPNTAFTIVNPTQIVPSTTNGGISSVQGFAIGNSVGAIPEPATMLLMGVSLLSLGCWSRKKCSSVNSFSDKDVQPRGSRLGFYLENS